MRKFYYPRRLCRSAWVGFSSPSVRLFVRSITQQEGCLSPTERASVSAISLRHILASPGYAPRTIAVNVTWMKRAFNTGQTHNSIYPSIFNRIRAIARYWSEIAIFFTPCIWHPRWGWSPLTIFVIFGGWVAGWPGYNIVQKIPEKLNPLSRVHARHRRICHGIIPA